MAKEPRRKRPELALEPPRGADKGVPVTFRVQRLEARLLWALAAFTIWLDVVLYAGEPVAWLIAALVAVVGAWSQQAPARHPAPMFARAVLLLAGGFMLEVHPVTASSWVFIWPALVTTLYSMLLGRRWVLGLWCVAAACFAAARVLGMGPVGWQAWLLQAGALAVFSYAAFQLAQSTRDLDEMMEVARRDRASRLYNDAGFFSHGGELFAECARRKRPFSLVLLNSADLRDASDLAGKKATNQLFAQLVAKIDAATPPEGLAARSDTVEFAMALPGFSAARAAALVQQQLGNPPAVEVTLKGRHVKVLLDFLAAESSPDVTTLEDMYDRLRGKLLRRAGDTPTTPASEFHSTLQGMLEADSVIPHHARPTMPMSYGDSVPAPVRRA